jgi:hypothetical protein
MQLCTRTLPASDFARMANTTTDGGTDDERSTAATTHDAVVTSAWRCVQHALAARLPDDTKGRDLYASDEVFRQLHECVTEYAGVLRLMGDDEDTVARLMLRTLDEAAAPGEPHPALRDAVDEWTRHAYRAG